MTEQQAARVIELLEEIAKPRRVVRRYRISWYDSSRYPYTDRSREVEAYDAVDALVQFRHDPWFTTTNGAALRVEPVA